MQFTTVDVEARKKIKIRAGDTVKVYQKIQEKGKTRIQIFEGLVLSKKHGTEPGATFTVRRITGGFGVEKIFPLYSPMIDKIEIIKNSKVRQSKLYHIRKTALKQIRKRMKMSFVNLDTAKEEEKIESEKIEETSN
jgi:large subunit ribosomal protein L19